MIQEVRIVHRTRFSLRRVALCSPCLCGGPSRSFTISVTAITITHGASRRVKEATKRENTNRAQRQNKLMELCGTP